MPEIDLSRAVWHKSSYSSQSGNCVEVAADLPGMVAIRDSKNFAGPRLLVPAAEWRAFLADLKVPDTQV